MVLTLLAILIAALVGLAIASVVVPRRVVTLGTAGVCGLGGLLVLASLLARGQTAMLALPVGPPGGAAHLTLDPLGAPFLLLLFVPAVPCAVFADAERDGTPATLAGLPAWLAAMALTVLADDAFTLALGLGGVGVAGWLLLSRREEADETGGVARSYLGLAAFSAVCLVAAVALMAPPAVAWLDCDYGAIRAAPPEGWRAFAVLVLSLIGAAGLAGLFPAHGWVSRTGSASALLVGVGTNIGIYVLFRVLLDLCGSAQPQWWGAPLLLIGAVSAVIGPLRATFEMHLEPVLAIGSLHQMGLAVMGLGVALFAHAADLPQVAGLALDASWLLLVTHALCRTLLLLCAGAAQRGAGTRRLDRLGGLIHRMPVTGSCALAGLFGAAMLPPGLGFAGLWLLFQSLLGAFRIGGFGLQLLIALAVLVVALSASVAAMAAVQLAGVVFLGRPRTPRTAVAEEVPRALRLCVISLATLTGLLAILPGLALLPATQGLARLANGSGHGMSLVLKPAVEAPGYAPIAIAGLLALVCYVLLWFSRRRGPGHRREPAWSGGFAAPPPWMPFGDPATQIGAASFAEPLHRILGPWPVVPGAIDLVQTSFVRLCDALCRASRAASRPGIPGSIAVTLAALVVAIGVWLVAS
ncbi:MAG TPA: proton-conducting transporter membrane subunit [Acetobacteraceae bacterium]|nr:proton-conducting transporter membrane subunit [Acetobacteraceae bacterium]